MSAPHIILISGSSKRQIYVKTTSIFQLPTNVPMHYRELFCMELTSVHKLAIKSVFACQACLSFKKYQAMNTFFLAILWLKVPMVQCSHKYLAKSTKKTRPTALKVLVKKAKQNSLEIFVLIKKTKLFFSTTAILAAVADPQIKMKIDAAFQESNKIFFEPPAKDSIQGKSFLQLQDNIPFLVNQVSTIFLNKQHLVVNQKAKQLLIYQKADVEITNASSLTIMSAVEVASHKREAEVINLQKWKDESITLLVNHYLSNIFSCKEQKTAA